MSRSRRNNSSLANRLSALKADGPTQLFDAEMLALRLLFDTRDEAARSLMIVFSDGEDNASRLSAAEVVAAAQKKEIAIYAVDMNHSMQVSRGSRTLQWMATATGGLHLSFGAEGLPGLLSALDVARAAYVVTYVPPRPTAGAHWVRVLPMHDLNLAFHSRQSYWYAGTVASRSKGAQ